MIQIFRNKRGAFHYENFFTSFSVDMNVLAVLGEIDFYLPHTNHRVHERKLG